MSTFTLHINGTAREVEADPAMPLLFVLRDVLELTGTKYGCGAGICGACTVHVDGKPVRSCQRRASELAGRKIVTIEGLGGKEAEAIRKAWLSVQVSQCGYCQPGQVMNACALLRAKPKPTDADIDRVMSDVVCRCGTYQRIRAAIHEAAR
jgi:isoquinoline 1-oxidoreductase alpha subunit